MDTYSDLHDMCIDVGIDTYPDFFGHVYRYVHVLQGRAEQPHEETATPDE